MQQREFTEKDLNEFFLRDSEHYYLKDEGGVDYEVKPEIEGAQIFSESLAMETINLNPERDFIMERVGDVLDVEQYEIEEQI